MIEVHSYFLSALIPKIQWVGTVQVSLKKNIIQDRKVLTTIRHLEMF
jgi:hypothetical protein